jgi:hypothetical protein
MKARELCCHSRETLRIFMVSISELSKDPDLTYFEARTEAFSPFAVSGLKDVVVPAAGPETAAPEVTVTVPPPSAKPPGMAWLYALIIIAVIAIAAYYLYTAAKKKEKK